MCFGYHVWKFLWNLLMMDLALETKLCVKYSSLCLLCCFLFGRHFSVPVQCIMFHCFSKSSTVWMCVEREGSMKRSLWTAPCFTRRSLCEFWQRFLLTFHMSPVLETLRLQCCPHCVSSDSGCFLPFTCHLFSARSLFSVPVLPLSPIPCCWQYIMPLLNYWCESKISYAAELLKKRSVFCWVFLHYFLMINFDSLNFFILFQTGFKS